MDKELKGYIDNLTTTALSLQEQINATNTKIEEVKTALQSEISTAKSEVLAQLATAKTELENELTQINATIETLKAKDEELDKKIADLKTYVDTELKSTKDWVNATFATLEQYNALVSEVATIKEQIKAINQSITDLETKLTTKINEDIANAVATLNADIQQKVKDITDAYTNAIRSAKEEITAAYTKAIQNAINALDASLKSWVGEQLSNYYTIAEIDAKIAELQKAITDGDSALQQQLNDLKSQLETAKAELTEAYKKAIKEAIETNNGVINTKIANEIASVNQRIDSEVATINAKIATLEAQVNKNTEDIAKLLARIQSISYIPTYSDGKATVKYNGDMSRVALDFEVSPKDAVVELAKMWQSAVSVKAIYTQTRAVSFIDMPIVNFEADATNGVISVTASAENLSEEFFNGTQSASVRLSISDGNNSVVSDYVPMTAKWEAYNSNINIVFIKFAEDMNLIAEHPDASVELMDSVNMKDVEWIPINFSGTFNGNSDKGYEIKNLSAPLFENISGTVKNLQISVDITKTSAVQLGGLANSSNGIVDNCDVSGKISMTAMSESNTSYISGVVGLATAGSLSNLTNNCSINVIGSTYNEKDVNITGVAHSNVDMTNCINNGDLYADGTFTRVGVSGITSPRQAGVKIICCENRGKLDFDGAATKIWMGGISAYVPEGPIEYIGCKNSGEITYTAGAITNRGDVEIAGVLAYSNNRSTIEGCCNEGTIDVKGQVVYGKLLVAGICANSMANTFIQNSTFYPECSSYNKGKISVSATRYKELYVGGGIGRANGNQTKGGNTIIDSFVNYACIDIAPHIINTATYVYIGGCVGKMNINSELFADASLSNIGDVMVKGNIDISNPRLFIGGIVGRSEITISNCQAYCNIKAIDLEGMAGMIMGQARAEATKAINCKIGGNMVFESTMEEVENPDGYTETLVNDVLIPITAENFFEHIYPTAITETQAIEDGCEYLAIKPSIQ